MSKIKILVVPSDRTGVSYFRSTIPHIKLEEYYPNDFYIDIDYEPKLNDDEYLKQYDLIHYHRTLGEYDNLDKTLDKLDKLGIVSIMDIDDHWSPGVNHPAWELIRQGNLDKKIARNLHISRNIITTTTIFANEIERLNKNVFILPNAINPEEKQYTNNVEKSDRIRIGWLGGSSHLKDLEILGGVVNNIKKAGLIDKVQFVLCGYDLRGSITMIDKQTGKQKQRKIKPKESIWYRYEQIFTDNYSIISNKYKRFLLNFVQEEYENVKNEPYRRVWTKPITSYATNYNLFDISLAPLKESPFNKVKSQLKVIEAGFHKKALIAQDFGPYTIDIKNVYQRGGDLDLEGNGILIPTNKNHKFWFKHLKTLIENPHLIKTMGENLHNTVNGQYDMKSVCKKRKNIYMKLIKEKKESVVENVV
jgi:glycosyltransferase involved in cell wall biosynthesis